jgi:hypothetical protein
MEHFQMARQETRIVDIGLPNKRGNTITRQKLRPACRRFAWVNSRLWSDYELTGSYSESKGPLRALATSLSTCLCSRLTGQVKFLDSTSPVTAFIRTLDEITAGIEPRHT